MAAKAFLDFEISIQSVGDGICQAQIASPAGQAEVNFPVPLSEGDLKLFFLLVGRQALSGADRRIETEQLQEAKKVGGKLFKALFQKQVLDCFQRSQDLADDQDCGLRLRLCLNDPQLIDFPWEYLYDEVTNRFVGLSTDTPIVRYLDLKARYPRLKPIEPPVRVLVMLSNPSNAQGLKVVDEWGVLYEVLYPLIQKGLFEVERLKEASLDALQERLQRQDFHIFHFSGHSRFIEHGKDGLLLLESDGLGVPSSGQKMGLLLSNHRSLRLVILNSCEGGRTSQQDVFAGIAPTLVQQGVPAVAAMQFPVSDEAALRFTRVLYESLGQGQPPDQALTAARLAIFSMGRDLEWGNPVLFTRSKDGRILELFSDDSVSGDISPVAPPIIQQTEGSATAAFEDHLEQLYQQGINAYWKKEFAEAQHIMQEVCDLHTGYKQAEEYLRKSRLENDLATAQQKVDNALQLKDWLQAEHALEAQIQLLKSVGKLYDVPEKLYAQVVERRKVADFYTEAQGLAQTGNWEAVANILNYLQAQDKQFIDELNLGKQARLHLLYQQARKLFDREEWSAAEILLVKLIAEEPGFQDSRVLLEKARQQTVSMFPLVSISNAEQLVKLNEFSAHTARAGLLSFSNIESLVFSSDGCLLISAGRDKTIEVRRVPDGSLVTKLKGHSKEIQHLAVSLDGKWLASSAAKAGLRSGFEVKLWALDTFKEQAILVFKKPLLGLFFMPDSLSLFTVTEEPFIQQWKIPEFQEIGRIQTDRLVAVAFSPDGKNLAGALVKRQQCIQQWELPSGKLLQSMEAPDYGVIRLAFSPHNAYLASIGLDVDYDRYAEYTPREDFYHLRLAFWNCAVPKQPLAVKQLEMINGSPLENLVFSPDGKLLAGSGPGKLRVWATETGQEIAVLTLFTDPSGNRNLLSGSLAFSPLGNLLAFGIETSISLWGIPPASSQTGLAG